MKRLIALAALSLVGCSQVTEEVTEPKLVWKTLADGSRTVSSSAVVIRCWGSGCLGAGQGVGDTIVGYFDLPRRFSLSDFWFLDKPYQCRSFRGLVESNAPVSETQYSETVEKNGQTVLTSSRPLSEAYVNKFMADNDIDGQWFDCAGILAVIEQGSPASLATTLVSAPLKSPPTAR